MSKSFKRHFLKDKESRKLIRDFAEKFKGDLREILKTDRIDIESVEADGGGKIFVLNGKPLIVEQNGTIFPSLMFNELFRFIPRIVVDMGAIRHVCNGADIMAPGIVRIETSFNAEAIVVIVDERHGKPLAVGKTLIGSEEIKNLKHGKVIKNLHYVGDKIWYFLKKLSK